MESTNLRVRICGLMWQLPQLEEEAMEHLIQAPLCYQNLCLRRQSVEIPDNKNFRRWENIEFC